ncbi:hypothetical protein [Bradyrhizobium sp. Y36]|uniref:hypothetical protein n=1 Tax=Bradyrhizobium sp. Y36 TaxID=2035447 RepID=UPI0011777094|nr:hypothetical protein [Bradyrhizobium sp. Y36]
MSSRAHSCELRIDPCANWIVGAFRATAPVVPMWPQVDPSSQISGESSPFGCACGLPCARRAALRLPAAALACAVALAIQFRQQAVATIAANKK